MRRKSVYDLQKDAVQTTEDIYNLTESIDSLTAVVDTKTQVDNDSAESVDSTYSASKIEEKLSNHYTKGEVDTLLDGVGGGSFSGTMDDIDDGSTYVKTHNDYTDAEQSKLAGIEAGADVTADNETSHADVLVDGDIGVTVQAYNTYVAAPMIILTKSSSVNQNIGGANDTEVWWTWDGEDKKDAGFTHSTSVNSERVQVDADGWYQIRFIGQAMQGGANRTTLQGIIRVDGGTTQRKGSVRDYTRGSGYGNASPGLDCIMQLSNGSYIEVGTRVEDTDATYTIESNGAEIADDENLLYIIKIA
jgi:hypothetical protein